MANAAGQEPHGCPRLDITVNGYPKSLVLGDFNRHARLDIVVTNLLDNSISVLLNGAR